jgi:gluconate 2-dehydrogenase alpha chain
MHLLRLLRALWLQQLFQGEPPDLRSPLLRFPNFTALTESEVTRINLDSTGSRATGVTFVDTSNEEWEQPADLVVLCAYALFNVRLMLLSGISKPYDAQRHGVVGRNYAYQTLSGVALIFKDKVLNPFIASGGIGMMVDEYNGDNFDHSGLGFVGGGFMGAGQTNGRPIRTRPVPAGVPKWGAQWKKATAETYNRAMALSAHGSCYSYRDCFLDLDPTYKDRLGRPLMRMTFDFHDNEVKMSAFLTERLADIAKALGPAEMIPSPRTASYTLNFYQTTHNTGGTAIGADPATSVVNRYCQSWDMPNVFVAGASLFPQNHGYNPTGTVGALAYWTADAIRHSYLRNPTESGTAGLEGEDDARALCSNRLFHRGCEHGFRGRAGLRSRRTWTLPLGARRLRGLSYRTRRTAFCRRAGAADAVWDAGYAKHHARSRDRYRKVDQR